MERHHFHSQEHRMSTIAINPIHRAVRFYEAPIGKKAVMAVTGLVLFGYVVAHLLGNLQIYLPDHQQINYYAAGLHNPAIAPLLLTARLVLLLCVALHIIAAVQLWGQNREARPTAYHKKVDVPTSYAARTMKVSGFIVAAFVIFHVLQLTVGTFDPTLPARELSAHHPDARYNVIEGFKNPAVAGFYILAMILLCMHLYHGIWSMFQSFGVSNPRVSAAIKRAAKVIAIVIAVGNISIPVAVLTGLLEY
jgi:succinate dehydrogenase / fumarate reductase, cytochrome b subunit